MTGLPALEIGGSHVTAALVDPVTGEVGPRVRRSLDGDAQAPVLLAAIASAGLSVCPGGGWGVAVPGPFDYEAGVGRFAGVGKFAALNGVDVGAGLRARLGGPVRFVNDAVAFGLGEWRWGSARGHARAVGVTLGTGIGSSFLADGRPVTAGTEVPPEGRADLLRIDGVPLEDVVSGRAVVSACRAAGGSPATVADVLAAAGAGDPAARAVVDRTYHLLGAALSPWLTTFEATILVVGGGISAAWDLVSPPLRRGLATDVPVVRAADTEAAALRGATQYAVDRTRTHR
ncbi:ROK family protein [Actinophytocola oryzae]|uniref:Glucokinase n=1 Tax=Actinophytocola oryzae TaxID=502181 RepID=A0A4R7W4L5_9PSEU|nr:ROK family protein [Actinophytocola oryzae]TDV57646.1 glucokinase [Actinophytocola oryzae]